MLMTRRRPVSGAAQALEGQRIHVSAAELRAEGVGLCEGWVDCILCEGEQGVNDNCPSSKFQ